MSYIYLADAEIAQHTSCCPLDTNSNVISSTLVSQDTIIFSRQAAKTPIYPVMCMSPVYCTSMIVLWCSDDSSAGSAINDGDESQVMDMMSAAMSPSRHGQLRTCFTACTDVQSGRSIHSCFLQRCNWNVDTAASMNLAKRWGNRICMETHCRSWQGDIDRYFTCGLEHCS